MKPPKKSKRFEYNLETVLKVRKIRETQQKEVFNQAERDLQSERQKEQELKNQQNAAYADLLEIMSGGEITSMQKIELRKAQIEMLKSKIDEQAQKVQEAEAKVEEEREKLTQCVKDRRILEKDKEKKRELWKKLMEKEFNKFLDEIAGIGYVRKTRQAHEDAEDDDLSNRSPTHGPETV